MEVYVERTPDAGNSSLKLKYLYRFFKKELKIELSIGGLERTRVDKEIASYKLIETRERSTSR